MYSKGNAIYDFSNATDEDWYCITEYTVGKAMKGIGDEKYEVENLKIKTSCKLRALELVGKHIDVQAFTKNIHMSTQWLCLKMTMEQKMSDFKTRLKNEYEELSDRAQKLGAFIGTTEFEGLDIGDQVLLLIQEQQMLAYKSTLHRRMEKIGV